MSLYKEICKIHIEKPISCLSVGTQINKPRFF